MAANWTPTLGIPPAFAPPNQQQQSPHNRSGPLADYPGPYNISQASYTQPWFPSGQSSGLYVQDNQQPPYTQQLQHPPHPWTRPPFPPPESWNHMQQHFPSLHSSSTSSHPTPGHGPGPAMFAPFPPFPQNDASAPAPFLPLPPAFQSVQQKSNSFPRPVTASEDHQMDISDSDKEEGEVSEAGRVSPLSAVRDRAHRQAPRSVPHKNTPTDQTADEQYDPNVPAAGHQMYKKAVRQEPSGTTAMSAKDHTKERETAKQFIKLLNSNNMGYHTLAAEGLDLVHLRALYRSLNLPSEPETVTPAAEQVSKVQMPLHQQILASNEKAYRADAKSAQHDAPASKTAAAHGDRKDYIARLQAAKSAKQSAANTAPAQQISSTVSAQTSVPIMHQLVPKPSASLAGSDDAKKARQTELIRQRLEALKKSSKLTVTATRSDAAPLVAPSTASTPIVHDMQSSKSPIEASFAPIAQSSSKATTQSTAVIGLPSGSVPMPAFQDMPTMGATPPSLATTGPVPIQPLHAAASIFPGIPGLFMNSSPSSPLDTAPSLVVQSDESTGTRAQQASLHLPASPPGQESGKGINALSQAFSPACSTAIQEIQGRPLRLPDVKHPSDLADGTGANLTVTAPPTLAFQAMSQPSSAGPPSVESTPGPQTPASMARADTLSHKEKELAAAKLRLQQKMREQRERKVAAAAAATSAAASKTHKEAAASSQQTPIVTKAEGWQAPVQSASSETTSLPSRPQNHALRVTTKQRRAEIESGLPTLEADIANNATRLSQLAQEIERLTASDRKLKENKARLIRELEELGVDTDGVPHEELQAQMNQIIHDQQVEAHELSLKPPTQTSSDSHTSTPSKTTPRSDAQDLEHGKPALRVSASMKTLNTSPSEAMTVPVDHTPQDESYDLQTQSTDRPSPLNGPRVPDPSVTPAMISANASNDHIGQSRPHAGEHDLPNPLPTWNDIAGASIADSAEPSSNPTLHAHGEDHYPAPEDRTDRPAREAQVVSPSLARAQDEQEIEVAMSESEEDYEPQEMSSADGAERSLERDVAIDMETSSTSSSSDSSTEDDDMYEPEDTNTMQFRFEQRSEAAADLESSPLKTFVRTGDEIATGATPRLSEAPTAPVNFPARGAEPSFIVTDEVAPGQSTLDQYGVGNDGVDAIEVALLHDVPNFEPYDSPLKRFKSYRYHKDYCNEVPGGFLSMTYSHQIDPNMPLCLDETNGDVCTDPKCLAQHFRDMNLTGEKLLVQLGTANPGKTPDERTHWIAGLRSVLKDLRQKNTKDPHGIAMEIIKYRRDFLKDDSRVLNL